MDGTSPGACELCGTWARRRQSRRQWVCGECRLDRIEETKRRVADAARVTLRRRRRNRALVAAGVLTITGWLTLGPGSDSHDAALAACAPEAAAEAC